MNRLVMLMAGAIVSAPATAAPVNLHCIVAMDKGPEGIDLTLNEAKGTVSWQWENDPDPMTAPGVFTATKVKMQTITIDRVNLAFEQKYNVGDGDVSHRGTCKIQKVTRRF
jgi:hypothetical protein